MAAELDYLGQSRWLACLEICADGQREALQERQVRNTKSTASPSKRKNSSGVWSHSGQQPGGELWVRLGGEARQGNFVQGILQTWSGGRTR